jgi:hypothetical protein
MGISVPRRGPVRRLLLDESAAVAPAARLRSAGSTPVTPEPAAGRSCSAGAASAAAPAAPADPAPRVAVADGPAVVASTLADGRARIERGLAEGRLTLHEVLQMGLATLQQGLACRSVVFCLREARAAGPGPAQRLRGRFALGPLPAEVFDVQPADHGDLLAVVSARAVDTLIADAGTVAARMPAWWRERVHAGTFLLLPLAMKGTTLGLIYADKADAGSLAPSEAELAAARSLRDAMTSAFARGVR